jgi:tetratricopeptide (TPR) repeat protein
MSIVSAEPQLTQVLDEARAAFARSDWDAAREDFQRALAAETSAEALDGLGQTLWWLGEEEAAIELRTKAFAEYKRRGDADAAANIAIYLASEYRIAGNASVGNGWLGRGTRLLEGCGNCPAQVWLHIERSKRAATPEQAEGEAQRAFELARRIGDAALEGVALSHAGSAQIARGDVEAGMALLDEAMAIATSVESDDPMAIGDACCTTLTACERLADPQRALDWGRAISEFFRRRRFLPLLSWCRSVYAGFLIATGHWQEAERTLIAALEDEASRPNPNRATALVQLGDLRLRQGRLEEAGRLLAGLENRPAALRPIVQLRLARGEIELAAETVERQLEWVPHPAAAAPLLALRAEVEIARSNASAAVAASAEAVPGGSTYHTGPAGSQSDSASCSSADLSPPWRQAYPPGATGASAAARRRAAVSGLPSTSSASLSSAAVGRSSARHAALVSELEALVAEQSCPKTERSSSSRAAARRR